MKRQSGDLSLKVGRDAPRYLLRLPESMLHQLRIDADLNGRSVNSEILTRLNLSLDQQARLLQDAPRVEDQARAVYRAMSDTERALLKILRSLPTEKQLALISLFK